MRLIEYLEKLIRHDILKPISDLELNQLLVESTQSDTSVHLVLDKFKSLPIRDLLGELYKSRGRLNSTETIAVELTHLKSIADICGLYGVLFDYFDGESELIDDYLNEHIPALDNYKTIELLKTFCERRALRRISEKLRMSDYG